MQANEDRKHFQVSHTNISIGLTQKIMPFISVTGQRLLSIVSLRRPWVELLFTSWFFQYFLCPSVHDPKYFQTRTLINLRQDVNLSPFYRTFVQIFNVTHLYKQYTLHTGDHYHDTERWYDVGNGGHYIGAERGDDVRHHHTLSTFTTHFDEGIN